MVEGPSAWMDRRGVRRAAVETYLLARRADAVAAMPLWLEESGLEGRDEREAVHRAYLRRYL